MVISLFLFQVLNNVDLCDVQRGASVNATARALVRTAYGKSSSFNCLGHGEFDLLLGNVEKRLITRLVYITPISRHGSSIARATSCVSILEWAIYKELAPTDETWRSEEKFSRQAVSSIPATKDDDNRWPLVCQRTRIRRRKYSITAGTV